MPAPWSPDELTRSVQRLENQMVPKGEYASDLKRIEDDVADIKATLTWALRLVIAQFFGLLVALVLLAVQLGVTR